MKGGEGSPGLTEWATGEVDWGSMEECPNVGDWKGVVGVLEPEGMSSEEMEAEGEGEGDESERKGAGGTIEEESEREEDDREEGEEEWKRDKERKREWELQEAVDP